MTVKATKRHKQKSWTPEQIEMLKEAVVTERTAAAAFEKVATATGRSKGAVAFKFYELKRGEPKLPAGKRRIEVRDLRFGQLNDEQLARVAVDLRNEIEARRAQLAEIEQLFAVR